MRALLLLAAILAACGGPEHRTVSAPSFKLTEYWGCPYPPQRGFRSVDAAGRAELVVFEGLEPPPAAASRRQKKKLTPEDVAELAGIAAEAKSFPERAGSFPPKHEQSDPCDRSLEITLDGATYRTSYRDGDVPEDLAAFLKRVDLVIERGSWEPDVYPWEKR